ncbi:MAG: TlpA disulfide reductase family protein, partial [Bacteroidota bacterium]|nr:TlpA disulfide reductase family protein [Bacteroidota bacterium]
MKYKKFAFPFLSIMIRTNLSFVLKAISLKPVLLPFKLNLWARGPVVSSYFFLFVFAQTCFAQTTISALPGLEVGDGAPGLKVEKWIKGGGFNSLSKGKIYVIDLWATWCVPCIASMPHLSRLQAMYKDKGVEVIGITSVDKYGNTLPKIEDFVHRRDSVMQYNVALVPVSVNEDGLQGIFVYPWMQQIGSMNLPTAFVVDRDGKVAYIGDPHTIDKPLEEMVNNEYDMRVAIANYRSGAHAAALLPE